MLYDQGQLANAYLDAFSITKDVFYSYVSRDILDYLRRDMIGPEGEIFSAEDADSAESDGATRKKEGAFYIWTTKEVVFPNLITTSPKSLSLQGNLKAQEYEYGIMKVFNQDF